MNLLDSTSRVAFAALIHDLGKFAQRAGLPFSQEQIEVHKQLYCPRWQGDNGGFYWTHEHSAYTALAFDVIECAAPDLVKGDMFPFVGQRARADVTDSLINAAASHHSPTTFLQSIVAVADRVSSGFERHEFESYNKNKAPDNFRSARLVSLLEQIRLNDQTPQNYVYASSLSPLSANSLFPKLRSDIEPKDKELAQKEYEHLWHQFVEALSPTGSLTIPRSHKKNWSLWLDHFDTAWLTFTCHIPSATAFNVVPDVSLYDHSKSSAALAAALWRWHEYYKKTDAEVAKRLLNRSDWAEKKFVLIQGDFFGIQEFIFSRGEETQKASSKLLRGRSFYVSLLSELAALRLLEALELPSTSQILNAAGKFMIVAPNTPDTLSKVQQVQKEIDQWFLSNTLATGGIGLATIEVSCNDLVGSSDRGLDELVKELFQSLEKSKLHRFNLPSQENCVLKADYSEGVSPFDERLPKASFLPADQILVGEHLVKNERILVLNSEQGIRKGLTLLKLPIFGYWVAFADNQEIDGQFGSLASEGVLRRCWDYSMPENMDEVLWKGYARRNINGYVARFSYNEEIQEEQYLGINKENCSISESLIKPFEYLACEQRQKLSTTKNDQYIGQVALTALKGDVDHLGLIFQKGLNTTHKGGKLTFAKMASLSRQINEFFAVYLPVLCSSLYPNTYTVFAGGDDFFLIGPWKDMQDLAYKLQQSFKLFVNNPEVHFSCGLVMCKPAVPIRTMADWAEDALLKAKDSGRNAVVCHQQAISWSEWESLEKIRTLFDSYSLRYEISASYLYSLFDILDLASKKGVPEASIWRSRLYYRTLRMASDSHNAESINEFRDQFLPQLVSAIETFGQKLRIPLSTYFYLNRKN